FYVLALLSAGQARDAVAADAALAAIATGRSSALATAAACAGDAACVAPAMKLADGDVTAAGDALAALAASGPVAGVAASLRKSGHPALHASASDPELLRAAWLDAAAALARGFDDHLAVLASDAVAGVVSDVVAQADRAVFFDPLLRVVLGGLA